jgi:hypothetical protein
MSEELDALLAGSFEVAQVDAGAEAAPVAGVLCDLLSFTDLHWQVCGSSLTALRPSLWLHLLLFP